MQTYSRNINGIRFSLNVEEVLLSQTEVLWNALSEIPADSITDGYKIQIGFSVFILCRSTDGFTVKTPDYSASPLTDITNDLSMAFLIQMEQADLLKEFDIESCSVRFDDKITVAKDVFQKSQFYLQHSENNDGSGWRIDEFTQNDNGGYSYVETADYTKIYAYQLIDLCPELLKVLVLPYNYTAIMIDDELVDILNENNKSLID